MLIFYVWELNCCVSLNFSSEIEIRNRVSHRILLVIIFVELDVMVVKTVVKY